MIHQLQESQLGINKYSKSPTMDETTINSNSENQDLNHIYDPVYNSNKICKRSRPTTKSQI